MLWHDWGHHLYANGKTKSDTELKITFCLDIRSHFVDSPVSEILLCMWFGIFPPIWFTGSLSWALIDRKSVFQLRMKCFELSGGETVWWNPIINSNLRNKSYFIQINPNIQIRSLSIIQLNRFDLCKWLHSYWKFPVVIPLALAF